MINTIDKDLKDNNFCVYYFGDALDPDSEHQFDYWVDSSQNHVPGTIQDVQPQEHTL